jgi:hypothetical protein
MYSGIHDLNSVGHKTLRYQLSYKCNGIINCLSVGPVIFSSGSLGVSLLSSDRHSRLADVTKQTAFHSYVTYRVGPFDSSVGRSLA